MIADSQKIVYNALLEMTAEEVVRVFIDYHGAQLLDDGFADFLIDEGYMEEQAEEAVL